MKLRIRILFGYLSLLACSVAIGNPYVVVASPEERQSRIDALTAAYDAMDGALLNSKGKVVVIKEVGDSIVVSFLNDERQSVYGGQTHVTYDPVRRKVISVEAEE